MAIEKRPFTLGAPDSSCQITAADLDAGTVKVNTDLKDKDDLRYWNCSPEGLGMNNAEYMGNAPSVGAENPQECAQAARSDAVSGSVKHDDLEIGQSFCVITDEENVALLKLIDKSSNGYLDPDLKFELTVWKRS